MPRPTTQAELRTAATEEYRRLQAAVEQVDAADRERPGACEDWSVKDILAHLHAWHLMAEGWEAEGSAGGRPEMPAPGFTWRQIPELNARIHDEHRDDPWDEVLDALERSHATMLALIDRYDDSELFTKKRYAWTGSTSVGSYLVSATSSHYQWASKLIRQWAKAAGASS